MGWAYIVIYLVILVASLAASYLLRPKGPPPPAPATLDDIDVPRAEEGKEVGVLFGTDDITEQNFVWWGNLYAEPIYLKGGKK